MAIGRTNVGGSGGSGGTLTVTAPVGVTVTVSKDGKTKTKIADSSGKAVFNGLKSGSWTVSIANGSQTAGKTVDVVTDYAVTMAFFSATIKVTYPAGSTLTCSDGKTTLTATTTTGSYTFTVPNTGTWTVKAVSGSKTDSKSVSITADGQSASVTLTYFDGYLFNYGSVNTGTTGGWTKSGDGTVKTNSNGSVTLQPTEGYSQSIYRTKNKIDLSNFTKLTLNGSMWEADGGSSRTRLCVWSAISYGSWEGNCVSYKGNSGNVSTANHVLDVSSLKGSYYVGVAAIDHPNWAYLTMNTLRLT